MNARIRLAYDAIFRFSFCLSIYSQSGCYIHFSTNTLGKGMKPFILPSMR